MFKSWLKEAHSCCLILLNSQFLLWCLFLHLQKDLFLKITGFCSVWFSTGFCLGLSALNNQAQTTGKKDRGGLFCLTRANVCMTKDDYTEGQGYLRTGGHSSTFLRAEAKQTGDVRQPEDSSWPTQPVHLAYLFWHSHSRSYSQKAVHGEGLALGALQLIR